MAYIKLGGMIFAFLALSACVWASESNELRDKAKSMQREAAELAAHGNQDVATNLKRKAIALLEEAEHLERHRPEHREAEIREMQERLEILRLEERKLKEIAGKGERLADVRREAEKIERELHELSHGRHHQEGGPHEDIARRLEHMRVAVEHLHHAGLHDIADHVAARAEAAERELQKQHRHHEGDPVRKIMKQLDEIRHEVGRLRDEVHKLREKR